MSKKIETTEKAFKLVLFGTFREIMEFATKKPMSEAAQLTLKAGIDTITTEDIETQFKIANAAKK